MNRNKVSFLCLFAIICATKLQEEQKPLRILNQNGTILQTNLTNFLDWVEKQSKDPKSYNHSKQQEVQDEQKPLRILNQNGIIQHTNLTNFLDWVEKQSKDPKPDNHSKQQEEISAQFVQFYIVGAPILAFSIALTLNTCLMCFRFGLLSRNPQQHKKEDLVNLDTYSDISALWL